jgi:spermidine/putrescine transport system substrate-binding protein
MAKSTGYNSVVKGASDLLDEASKRAFAESYPGDALEKLWWYPAETLWFTAVRTQYRDRFQAA